MYHSLKTTHGVLKIEIVSAKSGVVWPGRLEFVEILIHIPCTFQRIVLFKSNHFRSFICCFFRLTRAFYGVSFIFSLGVLLNVFQCLNWQTDINLKACLSWSFGSLQWRHFRIWMWPDLLLIVTEPKVRVLHGSTYSICLNILKL